MSGHASKQNPLTLPENAQISTKYNTHAKKNAGDKKVTEHVRWMLNSALHTCGGQKGLLHAGVAASERERR